MPIYKDNKRNTYYVSIRKKDSVSGKLKHITKRGFQTRREAKQWELEQIRSEEKSTSVTFAQLNQKYVEYKNARQGTQHQELMRIQKYFGDYCDKPISKIQKKDLLEWQLWLDKQAISTVTKNYMISTIKGTYKFASSFYGIPDISNVLKRFKKKQSEKKEMNVWTPEEFNQFISVETHEYYKAYFTFLYWTGCRRSEALALRKEDFKGNKVHIHHSIKRYEDGFQPLKNDSSERYIVMDDTLARYMKPFIERCTDDEPFVFGGLTPLPIRNIQRRFESDIKKSGVKRIRLHDLRHSHASLLINRGANIVAVSKRLGHATIQQTLQTYSHLLQESDDAMIDILNKSHS